MNFAFARPGFGAGLIVIAAAFAFGQPAAAQIASQAGEGAAGIGQGPAATIVDDQRGVGPKRPSLLDDQRAGRRAPPFGSELFSAGNMPGQQTVLNDPNYVLRIGDKIAVTTYGIVNETQEATIDPSGNIVLPNVGPIHVAGLTAAAVNGAVSAAAGRVYQSTVRVYAATVSAGTTTVFVTGPVLKPGGVAGNGTDSLVGFLQRAGGIDADRGSYRHIQIRRGGRTLGEADLYAFLQSGDLPLVDLHGGDTIVVGQQGPIVSVSGDARAPYTFEFAATSGTGAELLRYARPRPEVTHVSVLGTREGKPYNAYLTRLDFARFPLFDGDRISFEADAPSDTFVVRVEGAHRGPSVYTVNRGETLGPFLARLPLDPLADKPMLHLERVSVARAQKQLLDESLARLEKAIYTTPAPTQGVAQARAADAQGLQHFIDRARTVEPRGLVALPDDGTADTVLLEPDDVVIVPYISQTVTVAGEVELPQTLIWSQGGTAATYVERAGGFAARANRSNVLVIHPDGSTQRGGAVRAGDRVLVPPRVSGQGLQLVRDLTQILYQVAIAGLAVARF